MSNSLGERLLVWLLGRFYRFLFAALGAGFGLLWAAFGLGMALVISALTVLGFLVGKWVDEGRPDRGLSSWLRRFIDGA